MTHIQDTRNSVLSLFLRNNGLNRIKRYSIIAGLSLLGLLLSLVALGFLFEDEILDKVRTSVNERLDAPVNVGEMDFSLLSHFPQASITFHDLSIPDKLDSSLFLVQAEELSLHFDIWDIISGTYLIDKASLSHAVLRMHSNKNGELNYIFWKESESDDTEMSFNMEEFTLNEVQYAYQDEALDLDITTYVKEAILKVDFTDDLIAIQSDLRTERSNLSYEQSFYLKDQSVRYEGKMSLSADGSDMKFEQSQFRIGELAIELQGRINQKKEGWMLDLAVNAESSLEELIPAIPPMYQEGLVAYETKGNLEIQMAIKGISAKEMSPKVSAQFEFDKGSLGLKKSHDRVDRMYAKGQYERDEKGNDLLTLNDSRGELSAGHMEFQGRIRNLDSPSIDGKLDLSGELKDFLALMEESPFSKPKGTFELSVDLKGKVPTEGFKASDAASLGMRGNLLLEEIGFTLGTDGYQIADLNGEVLLKADDFLFDPLTLTCNGSALELSGSMTGLLAHMSDEKNHLGIKAKVHAEKVNWDAWVTASASQSEGEPARLPEGVDLALEIAVDAFQYAHFKAENVKGSLGLKGNSIKLDPMSFQSCQGELLASMNFVQMDDLTWKVQGQGDLRNMDISQILREFDHFGQTFITDKQLKAKGNAHIFFQGAFNSHMDVIPESILADADITLDNGELIQHPSMIDIINAMRDQKMTRSFVRIEELEKEMHHLKFKQMRNTIHIENGSMLIPEMLIANNAMDLRIAGSHTFKNDIDYTVSFSMRDVLINKNNPEFLIQDDGLGHVLNMRMYGTVDNPIIEMDKDKAKENRKEAITQAKEDVKNFFKDPLGRKTSEESTKHEIIVEVDASEPKNLTENKEAVKEDSKKKKWWNTPQATEEVKKDPVIIVDDDF